MTDVEFLKPKELAERLRVPLSTVYSWNYKGTGPPFVPCGKHIRYRWSDVEAWLREQVKARGVSAPGERVVS